MSAASRDFRASLETAFVYIAAREMVFENQRESNDEAVYIESSIKPRCGVSIYIYVYKEREREKDIQRGGAKLTRRRCLAAERKLRAIVSALIPLPLSFIARLAYGANSILYILSANAIEV